MVQYCLLNIFIFFVWTSACPPQHAHCYDCKFREVKLKRTERQNAEPTPFKFHISARCEYPCQCKSRLPTCFDGVNRIIDGCGCCYRCGRQQGDSCDTINRCDEKKGLTCDFGRNVKDLTIADIDNIQGTCRAETGEDCLVNGMRYKDGEDFKPDCRRLCTCQNGNYGCVSLCPQESKRPNCASATLVNISNSCCKEWVCLDPPEVQADAPMSTTLVPLPPLTKKCQFQTSEWSPCSATCDVGESIRVTNDNAECESVKETRLCMLRPCGYKDETEDGICRPTQKAPVRSKIRWRDCLSVKEWKPKYCSTCKKNRCCTANASKTIIMDFNCTGEKLVTTNYMWVKNCKCHKDCEWS